MHVLLLLLAMLADDPAPQMTTPRSTIDATIRGTAQPLEVALLLRGANDRWTEVSRRALPADTRRIHFGDLAAGVYQLRIRGSQATEQLAAKIVLGSHDSHRATIAITPFELTGRVSLSGVGLSGGALLLQHHELQWKAAIPLEDGGTFHVPLWQRGTYDYTISNPALATSYRDSIELAGPSPIRLPLDLPEGRITGVVRDAKSGAPIPGALVTLQTSAGETEQYVRLTTGPEGQFNFTGMKYARHTVRVISPQHLDGEPVVFDLVAASPLRELDIRLDPGRIIPIVVVGTGNEPVANAAVFAVAGAKLRSRTVTDAEGKTTASVPAGEPATLFVVPAVGSFGVQRLPREHDGRRVWIHLPRAGSSLLIRARTTAGAAMPPFSLLMRYDGTVVPPEVAEELTSVQGLQLATGENSEALLRNIPSGSYEFWPYRSDEEAGNIIAAGDAFAAPIQVNVREGENKIAVKFAARR